MQLSSMAAPMSYVPGEQVNLNQLGNSKDQIDRFLTKSANEFMLDPSGLKKRRKNPSSSNESPITLSHTKTHSTSQPINYSASLPNLNLDALSKVMLPQHQQLTHNGGSQHPLSDKSIKFGISSTSHSSSNSSDSDDEEDDIDDEEDEAEDEEDENDDSRDVNDHDNVEGRETLTKKSMKPGNSIEGRDPSGTNGTVNSTTNNHMNTIDTATNTSSQLQGTVIRSTADTENPKQESNASAAATSGAATGVATGTTTANIATSASDKLKLHGDSKKEPKFTMIKAPSSVKEIWREYTQGIDGRPSIKSLDQKFGNKWRANKNKKTYSRRKRMYKFILNGIKKGKSEEEMVQMLENKRIYKDSDGNQKKRTIGWLQQSLSGI